MREKKIKPSCGSCKFNFGEVCASHGIRKDNEDTYGSDINEMISMFPDGCEEWCISLNTFIEQEKMNGR